MSTLKMRQLSGLPLKHRQEIIMRALINIRKDNSGRIGLTLLHELGLDSCTGSEATVLKHGWVLYSSLTSNPMFKNYSELNEEAFIERKVLSEFSTSTHVKTFGIQPGSQLFKITVKEKSGAEQIILAYKNGNSAHCQFAELGCPNWDKGSPESINALHEWQNEHPMSSED